MIEQPFKYENIIPLCSYDHFTITAPSEMTATALEIQYFVPKIHKDKS
jgi:hypothetical protein